ncbi:MAG: hypothetical protein IIA61_07990 [Candidatus Marinimicrobia bacterium]|nr:hypothetical protein [Candidatus Neomarinimicrobiota bacterium]
MQRTKLYSGVILSCILLLISTLRPDGQAPYDSPLEIYLFNETGQDIFISYNAQGAVWDDNYYLTSSYHTGDPIELPANYTPGSSPTREYGFGYIDTPSHNFGSKGRLLAFSLYKISMGSTHFYLDLRTTGYLTGMSIDIDVQYTGTGFEWKRTGNCSGGYYTGPWEAISNGSTLRIWELFDDASCAEWSEENPPNTASFQPTSPSNLQGDEVNDHPRLNWTASSDPPWTTIKYKVRSSINGGAWSVIASNLTNTTYTDNGYTLEGCYNVAYKVSAYTSHPDESGYTDTVSYVATVTVPPNFTMVVINHHPSFNWDASQGPPGETMKYKVWRKYPTGGTWTVIRSNLTATTYTDYEVANYEKTGLFFYKVNAY